MGIPAHVSTCQFIDKQGWVDPERPSDWMDEPDAAWWNDKATGLPCRAVRVPTMGYWRGHVGVRDGHPLFGDPNPEILVRLTVHGGVSLSGACGPADEHSYDYGRDCPLCHEQEPGDITWLGFACDGLADIMPGFEAGLRHHGMLLPGRPSDRRVYRPLEFVVLQCSELAWQLGILASEPTQEADAAVDADAGAETDTADTEADEAAEA